MTGINRRGQHLEVILTATGIVTTVSEARNKRGGSKQGVARVVDWPVSELGRKQIQRQQIVLTL